jgi:predicted short-subunit dehydrogenase-like oxidoreductase (DUF2520 family)
VKTGKIYIIGCGKVGSSFAVELSSKGFEVSFATDENNEKLARISSVIESIKCSRKVSREFLESSDIDLISVQDRRISSTVEEIVSSGCDVRSKIMFHTSGSETSSVFSDKGINPENCASFHPIQTFMDLSFENKNLLSGIYFGIEGGIEAIKCANDIIEGLGSKSVIIPKEKKELYHTACVVSSNFLVTLLNVAAEFSASVGIDKSEMFSVFRPIIEKTIANVSNSGLVNSLTGPFERNDVQTIERHLDSISDELPYLIPFYTLLGMETVRVAFKKESLNISNVISILDLMNEYVSKEQKITEITEKK